MRVGYDTADDIWKGLNGDVPEIKARHVDGDYYYWVANRQWLVRFFGGWNGPDQALGMVLSADGKKIKDVPNFVVPDFSGPQSEYKARLSWVQGESDVALILVVDCPKVDSFRVRFDLNAGVCQFLGYGVR